MEQEGQQYKGQPIDSIDLADKVPVKKRKRLPSWRGCGTTSSTSYGKASGPRRKK